MWKQTYPENTVYSPKERRRRTACWPTRSWKRASCDRARMKRHFRDQFPLLRVRRDVRTMKPFADSFEQMRSGFRKDSLFQIPVFFSISFASIFSPYNYCCSISFPVSCTGVYPCLRCCFFLSFYSCSRFSPPLLLFMLLDFSSFCSRFIFLSCFCCRCHYSYWSCEKRWTRIAYFWDQLCTTLVE